MTISIFVALDGKPSATEIAEHLRDTGVAFILVEPHDDGYAVEVEEADEAAALAALDGWTPVTRVADGALDDFKPGLATAIRLHAGHLKNFRDEVRAGTQSQKIMADRAAQLEHVVADLIDWVRLTDDRL